MDIKGIIKTENEEELDEQDIQKIRDILKEQALKLGGQLYERCDEMNTFKAQVAKILENSEMKKKQDE